MNQPATVASAAGLSDVDGVTLAAAQGAVPLWKRVLSLSAVLNTRRWPATWSREQAHPEPRWKRFSSPARACVFSKKRT